MRSLVRSRKECDKSWTEIKMAKSYFANGTFCEPLPRSYSSFFFRLFVFFFFFEAIDEEICIHNISITEVLSLLSPFLLLLSDFFLSSPFAFNARSAVNRTTSEWIELATIILRSEKINHDGHGRCRRLRLAAAQKKTQRIFKQKKIDWTAFWKQ